MLLINKDLEGMAFTTTHICQMAMLKQHGDKTNEPKLAALCLNQSLCHLCPQQLIRTTVAIRRVVEDVDGDCNSTE